MHAGYLPGVDILRGLSIEAQANAITLVIGPNGAGKSTLLRTVFAFLAPQPGQHQFSRAVDRGAGPKRAQRRPGVSYVTQDINSFPALTVEDNLRMGAWVFRRDRERLRRQLERAYATFPALADKRRARAGELSGGQGRMLSVAREMMTEPQLLLVDEPTAGLAPNLVEQVYDILLAAKTGERRRDPAGRAECRAGAAARRSPLSAQSRPGEGGRTGPRIRQHTRAGTDSGMSSGLTKGWGAFVDWRRVAVATVAVGIPLALVPLITGEFVLHVLNIGAYYVILAVSWNLLAGFTGQFSLAQHAFAAIGAYTSGLLIYHLQTPLVVSIPAGILAAGLGGYLLGRLVLRMRTIYLSIATWAFAETYRIVLDRGL